MPTGKCKRGRWQTERAKAKKKQKMVVTSCGSNMMLQSLSNAASLCRNIGNADGSQHFGTCCLLRQLYFSSLGKRSLSKMIDVLLFAQKFNFDFDSIFCNNGKVKATQNSLEGFFLQGKVPPFKRNILSLGDVPQSLLKKVGLDSVTARKRCYFIMHKGSFSFNIHTSQQWANDFVTAEEMIDCHKVDESKIIEKSVPMDQVPSLMHMFATLVAKWKTPNVEVPVLQQTLQLIDKDKRVIQYKVVVALHISKIGQYTYFECYPSMPESIKFDSSDEDLYESLSWVDDHDTTVPLDDLGGSILQLLIQN